MSRSYPKILRNRKNRIARRLKNRFWPEQPEPMFTASNIHYEMADKAQAVNCGGIGAIHLMCQKLGLVDDLKEKVTVHKRHLPYHESDHVLNFAYNILAGGVRLEDIELRRNDEGYLNGLGAQRIPDPTTAGDFTRRFSALEILNLMEAINTTRQRVWQMQSAELLADAVFEVDGAFLLVDDPPAVALQSSTRESVHSHSRAPSRLAVPPHARSTHRPLPAERAR